MFFAFDHDLDTRRIQVTSSHCRRFNQTYLGTKASPHGFLYCRLVGYEWWVNAKAFLHFVFPCCTNSLKLLLLVDSRIRGTCVEISYIIFFSLFPAFMPYMRDCFSLLTVNFICIIIAPTPLNDSSRSGLL